MFNEGGQGSAAATKSTAPPDRGTWRRDSGTRPALRGPAVSWLLHYRPPSRGTWHPRIPALAAPRVEDVNIEKRCPHSSRRPLESSALDYLMLAVSVMPELVGPLPFSAAQALDRGHPKGKAPLGRPTPQLLSGANTLDWHSVQYSTLHAYCWRAVTSLARFPPPQTYPLLRAWKPGTTV